MKAVKHCRHVKEDGIACQSPAQRGESYCHFHVRYKGRPLRNWRARRTLRVNDLRLPPPEDFHAIQFSLNEVVQALTLGPSRLGRGRQGSARTEPGQHETTRGVVLEATARAVKQWTTPGKEMMAAANKSQRIKILRYAFYYEDFAREFCARYRF